MPKNLWPIDHDPFEKALRPVRKRKLPSVVVVNSLAELQKLIEPYMDLEKRDSNKELRKAIKDGALDDRLVRERYGETYWEEVEFVLLPAIEGEDDPRTFQLQGKKLIPPGK